MTVIKKDVMKFMVSTYNFSHLKINNIYVTEIYIFEADIKC